MGLRVYVAGPISKGDLVKNVRAAVDAGNRIKVRGHHPFIPHLTVLWLFAHQDHGITADGWIDYNHAWLDCCDVLVRLPGLSTGSDEEVEYATKRGIPVFHGVDAFMASPQWDQV